ncbi:hypothetical protein Dimus_014553 [Dionaea muscipula]
MKARTTSNHNYKNFSTILSHTNLPLHSVGLSTHHHHVSAQPPAASTTINAQPFGVDDKGGHRPGRTLPPTYKITTIVVAVPSKSKACRHPGDLSPLSTPSCPSPCPADPSRRPSTQPSIVHQTDQSRPLIEHQSSPLPTVWLPSFPIAAAARRDYPLADIGSSGVDGVRLLVAGR